MPCFAKYLTISTIVLIGLIIFIVIRRRRRCQKPKLAAPKPKAVENVVTAIEAPRPEQFKLIPQPPQKSNEKTQNCFFDTSIRRAKYAKRDHRIAHLIPVTIEFIVAQHQLNASQNDETNFPKSGPRDESGIAQFLHP
uniref:Uncharacterized protein n=1 Tax=Panagrolaimus davidi TaxID=227884 RepID=A0A914RCJ4_9BILA